MDIKINSIVATNEALWESICAGQQSTIHYYLKKSGV